jgi:pyruvate/2-oxoglutarate dehydrogenase complex dihydrolipoamide acyltransferase (E2) component
MGLSRRKYATRRGVSEKAVRKAIAAGRITVEADGTIDPVKADRQWAAQTDPAMQRGRNAKSAATKPVPKSALRAVDDTLRDAGALPEAGFQPEAGGEVSFMRARMANEVLKAQTAKVRLQKMKGELVDRASATTMVFDLARRERDAWLNWPSRVAANMAAELGVDTHLTEQVLDKYLRRHLADMAEIEIALR